AEHGKAIFDQGRAELRGKPKHAHGVPPNHEPLKQSSWATSNPGGLRENTDIVDKGREGVPDVPREEALSAWAKPGRSIYSPESYKDREIPAGETVFASKHNAKPKQRVEHVQTAENTAPHKPLRHHDRNEDGTNPLHG